MREWPEVRGDPGECDFGAAKGDGGVQEGMAYSVSELPEKANIGKCLLGGPGESVSAE